MMQSTTTTTNIAVYFINSFWAPTKQNSSAFNFYFARTIFVKFTVFITMSCCNMNTHVHCTYMLDSVKRHKIFMIFVVFFSFLTDGSGSETIHFKRAVLFLSKGLSMIRYINLRWKKRYQFHFFVWHRHKPHFKRNFKRMMTMTYRNMEGTYK